MGIPKFYRWLSERYPLINQPGGATVVPIIDNLYLDMNGIIHNCTHGNQTDVKLTEDEMIVRIFNYLDKIFHIVKPQKLLFMAIDGVAPRAKMNQQRARRFKSAREAEEAAAAAERKGEPLADADSRFDSNCITPGTPFMARLGSHLRFFVRKKIAEDAAWQKPTIVFSGHDVPGEGEHKIMEYIRLAKKTPGYVPNTRHCLYGLDADLIMLSLVTHEPHFNLLREVVSYTGGGRGQPAREVLENPCQEHFVLLQIGLLRDYLALEFGNLTLPFAFDLERIVDDFVLFCMMVGNDFLPPLPTMDIGEGSLDSLFEIYKELLPRLGGYLTFAGDLHRGRLEMLLKRVGQLEADVLEARATDTEEFENKKSKKKGGSDPAWASARVTAAVQGDNGNLAVEIEEDDAFALELASMALKQEGHELELLAAVESEEDDELALPAEVITAPTMMSREARAMFLNGDKESGLASWKARYYREKMGLSSEEQRRQVVESYIQGLHWVLEYYYRGVASWNWYYPYHYAPMASDLIELKEIDVRFDPGQPFFPYEQLLAVQPASSYRLLPVPYQHLMRETHSPIADFYPTEFRIDFEGKRAEWEGVVLIPFIDQDRLLKAARSVPPSLLSTEERARNAMGNILVFKHDEASVETSYCESTLPAHLTSVLTSNSKLLLKPAPAPLPAGEKGFIPQVVSGTKSGSGGPPGFPTLKTLAVSGELKRAGVNVFGTPSRKDSVILTLKDVAAQMGGVALPAQQVATALVGQRSWVKWPYLQEAVVEAVSDASGTARKNGEFSKHTTDQAEEWKREAARITNEYANKQGVDLGSVDLLLHVRPCEGLVRQLDGTVEKRFAKKELTYPLQVTLRRNPAPDPRFQPDTVGGAVLSLNLKEGSRAVFLGRAHYGCIATVLPSAGQGLTKKGEVIKPGGANFFKKTYRVEITPAPMTAGQAAQAAKRMLTNVVTSGSISGAVARRLGVSSRTLGRITSNVWVKIGEERRDRIDIGLCVKNAKNGVYVPDYAVPLKDDNNNSSGVGRNNNTSTSASAPEQSHGIRGWAYSDALVRLLEQYKQRFTFVWVALEKSTEYGDLQLEDLLPGVDKEAALHQVQALQKWLKSQPLARRPLIKLSSKVASEMGIKMLQAALPPPGKPLPVVELENVATSLLLPPLEAGGPSAALAGGTFDLADRVAYVGGTGTPPFGSRGTVVAVHEDAIEVLFDAEFSGGTDLYGRCNSSCGAFVPGASLLNLSKPHAIKAEGADAPRAVRSSRPAITSTAASGAANGAGGQGQQHQSAPMNPLAALAAASRGLQNVNAGGAATPKPAALQKPDQPKIPDPSGNKGFSMGRGKGLPQPVQVLPAPGPQVPLPMPMPMPFPPGHPPPPPPMMMMVMTPMGPMPMPVHPMHMMPPPPPPGAMMMHQPPPHGQYMPPGSSSTAPGSALLAQLHMTGSAAGAQLQQQQVTSPPASPQQQKQQGAGNALLAQLQRPAAAQRKQQQEPAAETAQKASGMHLLSQLQGATAPAPPQQEPASPPGAALLQQLQQKPAAATEPPTQEPESPSDLSSLWNKLQAGENSSSNATSAPPEDGPPLPPAPSLGLLAGATDNSNNSAQQQPQGQAVTMGMDEFWAKLSGGKK